MLRSLSRPFTMSLATVGLLVPVAASAQEAAEAAKDVQEVQVIVEQDDAAAPQAPIRYRVIRVTPDGKAQAPATGLQAQELRIIANEAAITESPARTIVVQAAAAATPAQAPQPPAPPKPPQVKVIAAENLQVKPLPVVEGSEGRQFQISKLAPQVAQKELAVVAAADDENVTATVTLNGQTVPLKLQAAGGPQTFRIEVQDDETDENAPRIFIIRVDEDEQTAGGAKAPQPRVMQWKRAEKAGDVIEVEVLEKVQAELKAAQKQAGEVRPFQPEKLQALRVEAQAKAAKAQYQKQLAQVKQQAKQTQLKMLSQHIKMLKKQLAELEAKLEAFDAEVLED